MVPPIFKKAYAQGPFIAIRAIGTHEKRYGSITTRLHKLYSCKIGDVLRLPGKSVEIIQINILFLRTLYDD